MQTIVVGLGNPILGDDAVGWKVVEQVEQQLRRLRSKNQEPFEIFYLSTGGLGLMEHLIGYDQAIIVDAINSQNGKPGTILTQSLEDLSEPTSGYTTSVHDTSLQDAVRLAKKIGVSMPKKVIVVGIETEPTYNFSEALTIQVMAAIPRAAEIVIGLLTKTAPPDLKRNLSELFHESNTG